MISKLPRWVWLGGAVLALSAGMINAVAFLGFSHQAATHVTGMFSHFSIGLVAGKKAEFTGAFLIIASFFVGAVLSGMIVSNAHLKIGQSYGWALGAESLLLFLSAYCFARNLIWGDCLAAMAAGLQNALASTYSGAIIRTTHMTGVLTDFGVLIGHALRGAPFDRARAKLFSILMGAFMAGGFAGAIFHNLFGNRAMLAPAIVVSASSAGYFLFKNQFKNLDARHLPSGENKSS